MSGHRVRSDLALVDTARRSSVDGELLTDRDSWGAQYLLTIAAGENETRVLPLPSVAGQRLEIVAVEVGSAGDCTITAPNSTDFDNDGNDELLFDAVGGLAILQSCYIAPGELAWRCTYVSAAGVALGGA